MERRIPFEITADPFFSEKNMQQLDNTIQQIKNDQVVVKSMKKLEDMECE